MRQAELYQWIRVVGQIFAGLGRWQAIGLALYSYGMVLARACAPSRVAEKLGLVGKVSSVERRLER